MISFLSEVDVRQLLRMGDAVGVVEDAFREYAEGNATMLPRVGQMLPGTAGAFRILSAVLPESQMFGLKTLTGFPGKRRKGEVYFVILLFEMGSGALRAVISANHLTGIRTGAASGVAAKYLARENAATLGVIGSGVQAWYQVEALCAVRNVRSVKVYSPTRDHALDFAERVARELGVEAQAVSKAEDAVSKSDLLVTATTSSTAVLQGDWLEPGMHLSTAGANQRSKRELDATGFLRSRLIVDSKQQVLDESGDLYDLVQAGELTPAIVSAELGDLVSGKAAGRIDPSEITVFRSVGLAIQDIAVATYLLKQAEQQGLGTWLNPNELSLQPVPLP